MRRWGSLATIAALAALAALPLVIGGHHGYGLGTTTAIAVTLALGYQVTWGLSGQLSVAHAPIEGIGAYAVAQLTALHGWPWWAALPLGMAGAAAVGAVVSLPGLRARGDVLALATLGAGEILQSLYLNTKLLTNGYEGIAAIPPIRIGHRDLGDHGLYAVALGVAALSLIGVSALKRSPLGRAWMAVRDDDVAARALGIRPARLRVLGFAIGGAVAGAAGALFAVQERFVSSVSFGLDQTVTVILIALVAGEGRLVRTVIVAAGFIAVVHRLTAHASVNEGVTGLAILAVVALRLGLGGAVRARVLRWRHGPRTQVAA